MAKNPTVTIKDVAKQAGVSIATVSYVLNDSAPISAETRARVIAAVNELNYRASITASNLRSQESRIIGYSWHFLPPNQWHPILDRFLYSMATAAETQGYHIMTFTTPHDREPPLSYKELMLTGRVDGFVVSDTNVDDERIRYLRDNDFPFVAFGRANEEWDFPYVDIDGEAGVRQAVEHLLELGHRRIGLLAWPEESLTGCYRYHGYTAALQDVGISPAPAWIVRCGHSETLARQAMHTILGLPPEQRPTAVVALSDLMALGAMNAIYEVGLLPGRDVAVIGFDDIPTAQYFRPPLTTLHQPIPEVGERVVNMLLQLLRGEELAERTVLLSPTLIVRESSGGMVG